MGKLTSLLFKRLQFVIYIFILLIIIVMGSGRGVNYTSNIGSATSLTANHFIKKYDNSDVTLQVKYVENMQEVAMYGADSPVLFVGQMTAYGPDCVGCTGKVSCPPRQNVLNGNIYYQDVDYGSVRILAADPHIPCGSMIKISNLTFTNEDVYGIVLDRGGVIKGNIIDFLVETEAKSDFVGRQKNVNFEIVRWGW